MCDPPPTFGAVAWNSAALTLSVGTIQEQERFNRYGEIIYGKNPEFRADVKFIANRPGFIVQEINRTLRVSGKPLNAAKHRVSGPVEETLHYWEVFYVSEREGVLFTSQVADSYLLGSEDGNYPSGNYYMEGISTFYPLPDGYTLSYDQHATTQPSGLLDVLKGFLGPEVHFDPNFTYAGGLPVAFTTPTPTLQPSYYQLVRSVSAEWNTDKEVTVNESFYYRKYDDPSVTCGLYVPRYELLPDTDTPQKQQERMVLTQLLRPTKKPITQATADKYIKKMISDNYNPKKKTGRSGGRKKKQTKRRRVKNRRTKRRNKKYI